ncbi:hypothetical protein QBC39DRAFT_342866 [Podospora conica]|nr:hypothetical protein QBC39DRAFT_342866 [Schizothecium conicum]
MSSRIKRVKDKGKSRDGAPRQSPRGADPDESMSYPGSDPFYSIPPREHGASYQGPGEDPIGLPYHHSPQGHGVVPANAVHSDYTPSYPPSPSWEPYPPPSSILPTASEDDLDSKSPGPSEGKADDRDPSEKGYGTTSPGSDPKAYLKRPRPGKETIYTKQIPSEDLGYSSATYPYSYNPHYPTEEREAAYDQQTASEESPYYGYQAGETSCAYIESDALDNSSAIPKPIDTYSWPEKYYQGDPKEKADEKDLSEATYAILASMSSTSGQRNPSSKLGGGPWDDDRLGLVPEMAGRSRERAWDLAQRLQEAANIQRPCQQLFDRLPDLLTAFSHRLSGEGCASEEYQAVCGLNTRHIVVQKLQAIIENPSTSSAQHSLHRADTDVVFSTASFRWLAAAARASCRVDYSGATALASIQAELIEGRSNPTSTVHRLDVTLRTGYWDPSAYIKEQGYRDADCLSGALTLSGTTTHTHMSPCRQYLKETWPFVGEIVLDALIDWIKDTPSSSGDNCPEIERCLFDGTRFTITASVDPWGKWCLVLNCAGLLYSVGEIIEAFAWLASTLREAPGNRIGHSIATLKRVKYSRETVPKAWFQLTIADRTFIDKAAANKLGMPAASGGNCWHDLFNNPVVSKGFPVPFRPSDTPGLEISLEAMATLVGAPRLTIFNNRAVLKGFNAAIFATACTDETVVWHLVVDKDGSRLRYSDERILEGLPMEMPSPVSFIQGKKHILGWVSNVSYNIGSPSANYDIGWSSPDFVGPGCALEKLIISGGPGFLSAGAEFSLSRKDPSRVIRRKTAYFDTLNSLSTSYVVLYDTLDCRAWLSNGLHALLHLVRASLRHDKEVSDLAAECLFDPSKLQEDPEPANPKAAINFLRSRHNLELPIFPDLDDVRTEQATSAAQTLETEYRTNTRVRLKDRVDGIMCVLEQLVDNQANLDDYAPGVPLRLTPRGKLEGFRFMDVATGRAISPRVVSLDASSSAGKSWVDFTRSIKAVTLFGEGFGELLEPMAPDNGDSNSNICHHWKTLPKDKDHLAVAVHDLVKIFRHEGSVAHIPLKLAAGIFWDPTGLFEACACKGKRWRTCNHAQALLPKSFLKTTHGIAPPIQDLIGDKGAVVFGRSSIFPFSWPDRGDPTPGKAPVPESGSREQAALENHKPQAILTPRPPTIMPSHSMSPAPTPTSQVLSTSSSETGSTGSQSSGVYIQESAPVASLRPPIGPSCPATTPPTSIASASDSLSISQVIPTRSGEAGPKGKESSSVDVQPRANRRRRELWEHCKDKLSLNP